MSGNQISTVDDHFYAYKDDAAQYESDKEYNNAINKYRQALAYKDCSFVRQSIARCKDMLKTGYTKPPPLNSGHIFADLERQFGYKPKPTIFYLAPNPRPTENVKLVGKIYKAPVVAPDDGRAKQQSAVRVIEPSAKKDKAKQADSKNMSLSQMLGSKLKISW